MRWTAVIVFDAPAELSAEDIGTRMTQLAGALRPEIITEAITVHSGYVYHCPVQPDQRWEDHHPGRG